MKHYLLECRCSATVQVGPGQAGGQVQCPRCGAAVAVPRLGELARLPSVVAPAASSTGWTAAHACLLGGGVLAVAALAAATYLGRPPAGLFREDTIRAGIAASSTADIYRAWQEFARSGVARQTLPAEERLQHAARSGRSMAAALLVIAAVGAAVAAGGGIAIARRRTVP